MKNKILKLSETEVRYSILEDRRGNWTQFFFTIIPEEPAPIQQQLEKIERAETELFNKYNIDNKTVALKRIFSSDLLNHHDDILSYKERQNSDFFFSIMQQPPATQVKLALLGMCISNITAKHRDRNIFYFDTTSGNRHIFAENILDPDADECSDAEKQTKKIFEILEKELATFNSTIKESVLRTWLYAPHVDADYPGIVKARKEIFDSLNMTKDTHYIASTGIQGGTNNRFARLSMDAYAVIRSRGSESIRFIEAPEFLGPTHSYGVTFERATAVELGQSDFLFISGTASINKEGEIVHPKDVTKQTERVLQNISALLDSAGHTKNDLSSFIVYLRDPSDYLFVKPLIDRYAENLPAVYLQASVCRPGWLIEIEATAAKTIL